MVDSRDSGCAHATLPRAPGYLAGRLSIRHGCVLWSDSHYLDTHRDQHDNYCFAVEIHHHSVAVEEVEVEEMRSEVGSTCWVKPSGHWDRLCTIEP